jgi:hypothetical protein
MVTSLCCFAHCAFGENKAQETNYLDAVKAYADAMIEDGRDVYGEKHSPLFASALDRETMKIGEFPDIAGIRNFDRCTTGSNPMHHQNLYQILYGLSGVSGEKKYAEEADKALRYFFHNCQSPATGFMAWGEHIGWDFYKERMTGSHHEFYRPWVLWEKTYQLAPEAAARFAKGVWEHQIYDHKTGEFSRHADWHKHGPGDENEYPRHGGFYIATWAAAYQHTEDPDFAEAVETLVDMYNRISSEKSGAIPCCTRPELIHIMWPESNLNLAIDLTSSAPVFGKKLRAKMLERARKTDEIYLSLDHDFSPEGIGFVAGANVHTLKPRTEGHWTHTMPWATEYGKSTDAQIANICYLRYQQLEDGARKAGYRRLILRCAERYLSSEPDLTKTIYPGPIGDAIIHLLAAHEISGERKYLQRAAHFAKIGEEYFITGGSPLPRASSQHEHYEAITQGNTLMMGLLKLWIARHKPEADVALTWCSR